MVKTTERNIDYLLYRYKHHVPGEKWTRRMMTEENRKYHNGKKKNTAQKIGQKLGFGNELKQQVYYLIDTYIDFKLLYSVATSNQIVGCLCFYVLKTHNIAAEINDYEILRELKISDKAYSIVVSNMFKLNHEPDLGL